MIKSIVSFLADKPLFGAVGSVGGGLAALLTKIQLLTPIIGFFAAITGLLIGLLTLVLKSRDVYFTMKNDYEERKKNHK